MWTIRISNGAQIFFRLREGLLDVRVLTPERNNAPARKNLKPF